MHSVSAVSRAACFDPKIGVYRIDKMTTPRTVSSFFQAPKRLCVEKTLNQGLESVLASNTNGIHAIVAGAEAVFENGKVSSSRKQSQGSSKMSAKDGLDSSKFLSQGTTDSEPAKILLQSGIVANISAPVENSSIAQVKQGDFRWKTAALTGDLESVEEEFEVNILSEKLQNDGSGRNLENGNFSIAREDNEGRETTASVSKGQRMRMEMNKTLALSKRNLRMCEERVKECRELGIAFPNLEDLLVEQSWMQALQGELRKPYTEKLNTFVRQEAMGKVPIYPPPPLIFNAFNTCPFDKVKVVILGQDPYHGPRQAMGLSFSVPEGVKIPSSLVNIYKEIRDDVGCSIPSHGNLEKWAHQGVLLLNAVLTVRDHLANSHTKKGWEIFTDAAIRAVAQQKQGVVFLLWGNSAQEKTRLIDSKAHHILKAAHPSGLSAHRGFFSCKHFSKTNKILEDAGQLPIDWQL